MQRRVDWRRAAATACLVALASALAWLLARHGQPAPPQPLPPREPAAAIVTINARRIIYPPGHFPRLSLPDGSQQELRSVLNVRQRMGYGDYVWDEQGIAPGPVWVRIDLARQLISVFRGGHEIGTAVIIYGTGGKQTPTGLFHILQKARDYYSKSYDAPMPYMLRLTSDGVALHASTVREKSATHGCIGTPLEFARQLFNVMNLGDPVLVLPAKVSA